MIDTKLLRQKILDLAIRGKLVPQDPADEPASELLKKIKAEKEALVKAGKIKKDKHESFIFKGDDNRYYETIGNDKIDTVVQEPFSLPDSWSWTNLGFIADVARGGSPRPIENYITESEEGVNWIKIGDTVPGCKYITHTKEKIIPAGISKSRYVEPGDFLLSNSMSFGRPYILKISGCIHDGWLVIHPQANVIYQDFLFYALSSPCIHTLFVDLASGSTVKNLKSDSVRLLKFPLPPYNEQKRIVSQIEILLGYVDIIDADAETLDKSITLAKQKILDLAIRGKLVPQNPADEPASELLKKIKAEKDALVKAGKFKKDKHESYIFKGDDNCYYEQLTDKTVDITDEVPFDLPVSWCWCRFSTLVNFVMGKTPARSQKEFWTMPFLPWVSIADMIPGGVITETKEFISSNALSHCFSGRISPAGTLIMSFKLTIGRVSILNMPAQHNEAIISIFPFVDQENIHRDYLLKILPLMVDFVKKSPAIKGNTLNSDSLSKMLIPLPPLAEQKRIVACITQYETILKSIQE